MEGPEAVLPFRIVEGQAGDFVFVFHAAAEFEGVAIRIADEDRYMAVAAECHRALRKCDIVLLKGF